ncbi:MAG TPA: helix-turn-helix transcriptional regulator [Burkholderiaceae bacterium]
MDDIDLVGAPLATRRPSARFGAVIRELRESRGWSQEQLAGQAGLNRSYMGEIERSAAMPSLASAEKLAQALGVALSALISHCERAAAR